ncbi:DUF998 domain-containing protein [Phycicoccus sonneratiae]|uniref:DUF998 domain-containing protein n=1 Tax=Phycicoccus sonneratiae TaxID=2807628 RepID=A0ABS2CPP6_9MICO|nr:DUF998 domain-containing protein [Phycicoccus sonneraticus]MBM6401870.1 DUF998 domain-containing protein [Phycicoccus sonneraticus]
MARPDGHLRTAVASATVAVVALVGGWTWAADLVGDGFDPTSETISALASLETPHRWVMTSALVVTGLAHLVTAWALGSARVVGRALLAAGGVTTVLVALFPLPSRTESSAVHTVVASASFLFLALWPALAARRDAPPVLAPRVARPAGAVLLVAVASLALGAGTDAFGMHERVVAALTVLWPLATATGVWWSAGHRIGSHRLRHALGVVLLTGAGVATGLGATSLAPATAETRNYQATVWLTGDPRSAGDLVAQTTFGDVRLGFTGVAPGVRVVPQVRANITDTLSRPGISLASLRPGPQELDTAIRGAAVDVLGRFTLGALLPGLVVLATWSLARRRRPPRALVGAAVAAWAVSTLGTGAALYTTYQPSRQGTFQATEVLGTLQRNQGLLGDVETRAAQVTPYLRNLLALSTALQQKYAAGSLEADPALRVLFVSDVHGGNQYALMRTIVEEESIDVVVDSGDLVNFGTVTEGEAAGIFDGIESVGVPYLFVRGNHDATSATDTAVLDRMARIPNVTLLQPAEGGYREVTVGGVTIAGFNDPRWFGDSGTGSRIKQLPARAAFEAAYADRPAPDVVVGHEPWAVQGLPGGVLLNGHMHSADLEGNRIQVGTFTGGGPFSHFLADEGGEELVGQPSSFDVLTFGTDCRLSSLTRYRFRDVIEGRPAYDDVSLTNGDRIDTRAADPARTCSAGAALTVDTVPAAPVAGSATEAP